MKWIEFVKDFAKKNNIKYGKALKEAKGAWAKHKESSPEHKKPTKPKKKAKKSKGLKMTIKEKAKKKNVEFALEKDEAVQKTLKKRRAKETLVEAISKEKTQNELLLEAREKGFPAGELANTEAKKQIALQKIKIGELKADADVPIGGAFDESAMKGVRKTQLAKFKKLKLKVEKDMKEGKTNNKEYNTLITLARHLAGKSTTNAYAKLVKKLDKQVKSKGYEKATRTQMRQSQKSKLLEGKLLKASQQDKARDQKQALNKVYENRVNQLKRLGASQEEAEKIATEETRSIKEQQSLERELQLAKFRKGMKANVPTGGLDYNQFVAKLSKDKGITFAQATSLAKSQNLYKKYQITAVKAAAPATPTASTALPVIATTAPASIAKRTQYLKKDGTIKKSAQGVIDRMVAKFSGIDATNLKAVWNVGGKKLSASVGSGDKEAIDKYKDIGSLPPQVSKRLKELSDALKHTNFGIVFPPKGKATTTTTTPPRTATPPPIPPKPAPRKGIIKATTSAFVGKVKDNKQMDAQQKFDRLSDFKSQTDFTDDDGGEAIVIQALKDLDNDIAGSASGQGLTGGFMDVISQRHLDHDGDDKLEGGSIRDIGKKFSNAIIRRARQHQMPINIIMRGVGKLKGRNVKKQNSIDAEDIHLLNMSMDSYTKPNERKNVDGFTYVKNASNDEHAVWINDALKKVVVAYRGSLTQDDWLKTDKHILKGKVEDSERYKREDKWTEGLVNVVPKGYEIEFTGHSLGGTLAYSLGHAHKQRAVLFNAGVGVDFAKKHGNDNTKSYHAEGDPVSVMGVGAFKDNKIVKNSAGNSITAHLTNSFLPPSKGGMAYGEFPEDHTKQEIASLENKEKIRAEAPADANMPPEENVNPSHYGDLGDFTGGGQQDVENMTQRDIDTYTGVWGGGLGFDKIAKNKIQDINSSMNIYKGVYSPASIHKELGGAFTLDKYHNLKKKHDEKYKSVADKVSSLHSFKKRTKGVMREIVDTHLKHFNTNLKHMKNDVGDKIPEYLDQHLNNTLSHDKRRLTDLHIHGIKKSGGSFNISNVSNFIHKDNHLKQHNKINIDADNVGHERMRKIINGIGKKIVDKIKGGGLTSRDHLKILSVSGKHLNTLEQDPHFAHFVVKNAPKNLLSMKTI